MNNLNVLTFGSCFSRCVCATLSIINKDLNVKLIKNIEHNRVDYFYDNFCVEQSEEKIQTRKKLLAFLSSIIPDMNTAAQNIVKNQTTGIDIDFLKKKHIDLIIVDTFYESCAKLNLFNGKEKIFFNRKTVAHNNFLDHFTTEDYLSVEDIVRYYNNLFIFFKKTYPNVKIALINFPYLHHTKQIIVERCQKINDALNYRSVKNCDSIIHLKQVSVDNLESVSLASHFKYPLYVMYAGLVQQLLTNPNTWHNMNSGFKSLYIPEVEKELKITDQTPVKGEINISPDAEVQKYCKINQFTLIKSSTIIYTKSLLGKYCSIGRNCEIGVENHPINYLSTHSFQYNKFLFGHIPEYCFKRNVAYLSRKPTLIGNDVWVGAKAVVKAGVTIGDGAVIGACAFVSKDVPPYAIVGGVPAKLIRYRFDEKTIEKLLELKWWDIPIEYLKEVRFDKIDLAIEDCWKAKEKWQSDLKAQSKEQLKPPHQNQ